MVALEDLGMELGLEAQQDGLSILYVHVEHTSRRIGEQRRGLDRPARQTARRVEALACPSDTGLGVRAPVIPMSWLYPE